MAWRSAFAPGSQSTDFVRRMPVLDDPQAVREEYGTAPTVIDDSRDAGSPDSPALGEQIWQTVPAPNPKELCMIRYGLAGVQETGSEG